MSYNFWFKNPSILIDTNYLTDFYPNDDLSNASNLNAIVRLSIYVSFILFIFRLNFNVFILPIITAVVTIFLYNYNNLEEKLSILTKLEDVHNEDDTKCMKPELNNIFMNTNLTHIGNDDNIEKKDACKMTQEVMDTQEDLFKKTIFTDINDIYNKSNSQMKFHTMPNTSKEFGLVGDTTKVRNWLYGIGASCKEDTKFCTGTYANFAEDHRRNRSTIIEEESKI